MSEKELFDELEIDNNEVIDYIREVTAENEAVNALTDDDLDLLLQLWYDYLLEVDEEGDDEDDSDVEVDIDDLCEYIFDALKEEEVDFSLSTDALLEILEAEQDYVESIIEDGEDEEL